MAGSAKALVEEAGSLFSTLEPAHLLSMSAKLLRRDRPSRSIALAADTHVLIFVNNKVELHPVDGADLQQYKTIDYSVYGTLGLITIDNDVFLCVVTGAKKAATLRPGENVQQILSVDFHCLNRADHDHILNTDNGMHQDGDYEDDGLDYGHHSGPRDAQQEHPCLALKKLLSSGSFYFSVDFDLTNRLQDRTDDADSFELDAFDKGFLWNSYMIKPLIDFRSRLSSVEKAELDSTHFLTSAIRGFALTLNVPATSSPARSSRYGLPSTLTLISRLSCKRAGTRFNARGIDDDGNVANFVETETIFWSPTGTTFSYVQIRGSIPLFWEQQPGLIPGQQKVQVTRSPQATQPAFDKHFDDLEMKFSSIHIVNLLSDEKPSEVELSSRYRNHVAHSPLNSRQDGEKNEHQFLRETDYDFHAETRDGRYEAAGSISRFIQDSVDAFSYCLIDNIDDAARSQQDLMSMDKPQPRGRTVMILQQQGVFRTNCLDCLDRTNLIQTIISRMAFDNFLAHRGERMTPDFSSRHSTLFADNGDALSRIYAGTGALKSSFTRTGKSSLAGALADVRKTATRMYINNFADKSRQMTMDLLLGRLMGQEPVKLYDPVNEFVTTELSRRAGEYSSKRDIQIWAGTLNLNGRSDGLNADLSPWLYPPVAKSHQNPHIVAIGFQEIVELSPQQIMSTEPSRRQAWEKKVKRSLNDVAKATGVEEYVLLRGGQLVGASLSVFIKRSMLNTVKNVEGALKKTGMSGMAGNKGAVAIRMEIDNTSLCFVTAHLAAGFANYEERNRDYKTISHGLRFQRNRSIEDHNTIIWLGDFNYRIGLGHDKVTQLAISKDYGKLYENDQLNLQMVAGFAFQHYSEDRVAFPPTYKYDVGTDYYDSSEKARIPAWCDRILRKGSNIRQHSYDAVGELRFSDHRPVYATFSCTVDVINTTKRDRIAEQLYHARRAAIARGDMSVMSDSTDGVEDLIGFDGVEPGLPPASSDKRKWWIEGGLPVRSNVDPPAGNMTPNPQRPSNPFSPTTEPDWVKARPIPANRGGGTSRSSTTYNEPSLLD